MKTPPAPEGIPPGVLTVMLGRRGSSICELTANSNRFVMACAPRPSAAAWFAASRIVPPFRVSAEAPMLIPSGSKSPFLTMSQWNRSVVPPLPET